MKLALTPSSVLAAAFLLQACGGEVAARPEGKVSVLLIVVSGLRADHVGCYGYSRPNKGSLTPHLDALAARGRWFTDVASPSPWIAPAVGVLLSGRYPAELGMAIDEQGDRTLDLTSGGRADSDVTLIARRLSDEGYRTGAVMSHPVLGGSANLYGGFERYECVVPLEKGGGDHTSARVTDTALSFLGTCGDEPFLLVAHYADPLYPWNPPVGCGLGDPEYEGPVVPGMPLGELLRLEADLSPEDLRQVVAHYDSEVTYVDSEVGRLLDWLETSDRLQSTLVVWTSTHGMEFLEHGGMGDSGTLHEEVIHVPLVMAGPHVEPGMDEVSASLVDVAPTLFERIELPSNGKSSGVSLLSGVSVGERVLFAETDRVRRLRAAMHSRWKMIFDLETGEASLYDLIEDPGEQHDRAHEPAAARAFSTLKAHLVGQRRGSEGARGEE